MWIKAAKSTMLPIKGHEHVGLGGTEVLVYPEGVIGRPTLADAEKAKPAWMPCWISWSS